MKATIAFNRIHMLTYVIQMITIEAIYSVVFGFYQARNSALATKMVALSVRIPQDDAEFIAKLRIEGAATPSDKLRAILLEARRRQEGAQDFNGCIAMIQGLLSPARMQIQSSEMDHEMHSELLSRVMTWLPDIVAYIVANGGFVRSDDTSAEKLRTMEQGVAERAFRLMESLLQMGVTKRSPCYDPDVILKRVDPIIDLASVISTIQTQRQEKTK